MKKRTSVILILLGVFISIAVVPFMDNYNQHADVMSNIKGMYLVISWNRQPEFETRDNSYLIRHKSSDKFFLLMDEPEDMQIIEYDNTNILLLFPKYMKEAEIRNAIIMKFPDKSKVRRADSPQYMEFTRWIQNKIVIRYRIIFLFALAVIFYGIAGLLIYKKKAI
jgi:hypothetical protein